MKVTIPVAFYVIRKLFDPACILQGFPQKVSLVKKDILLQHTRKSGIFRKILFDQRLAEPRFGNVSGAVAFWGVLPQQDLFDPGVHREGTDMVQTEEADAVGNFDAYAVAGEKSFHGVGIIQSPQTVKIHLSGADVFAGPLDILGTVTEF